MILDLGTSIQYIYVTKMLDVDIFKEFFAFLASVEELKCQCAIPSSILCLKWIC